MYRLVNKAVLGALVCGVFAFSASAASIADTDSIQFGDKVFSDFSVSANIDPASVFITGGVNPEGLVYIEFGAPFTSGLEGNVDFQLEYKVTAGEGFLMTAITQSFVLSALGTGGEVSIGESVWDSGFGFGNKVAQSTVGFAFPIDDPIDSDGSNVEVVTGDDLEFPSPLQMVWVQKDIRLTANEGGSVGATIITQGFRQTQDQPGEIPEPATMLLFSTALLGLGLIRKVKKS